MDHKLGTARRAVIALVVALAAGLLATTSAATEEQRRITRVSTTAAGEQAAGESRHPAASTDGRFVAFTTTAQLAGADRNLVHDVYRKDTQTGAVALVSVDLLGSAAGVTTTNPSSVAISGDGRFVVFESAAVNLVVGDVNGASDVFVRDVEAANTQQVNVNDDGTQATAGASFPSISADGLRIAFYSDGGLRTTSGTNPGAGVYVRQRGTGLLPGVTLFAGNTTAGQAGIKAPVSISDDGHVVAFADGPGRLLRRDLREPAASVVHEGAPAALLGPDAASGNGAVIAYATEGVVNAGGIASVHHDGVPVAERATGSGAISRDGRYVVFTTTAGALLKDRLSGLLIAIAPTAIEATLTGSTAVPVFSSAAADLVPNDTNGAADVFAYARDTAATPFNAQLIALDPVVPPGAFATPSRRLPVSAVPLPALDLVQAATIDAVDMAAAPLRSVPLRSVPLRSVPLRSVPLRSVLLSEVRLLGTTWDAILASLNPNPFVGRPLQSITLDEVLAADPPALRTLPLRSVDLSSTPLRSVSMASIALGATPLRSVPLPDGQSWCDLLATLGFACADHGLGDDATLLALDLVGVPLRSVPLRSVPLRSVDLSAAPLRSVPLRSVHLANLPIGTLIAPAAVADCTKVACGTATLADVQRADAFKPDATLGLLFDELVARDDLPGSLAELLLALIDPADYPWEQVPVLDVPMADHAEAAPEIRYELTFSVAGDRPAPARAAVTLPAGFRLVPGSATFAGKPIADPDASGGFSLGEVAAGTTGNKLAFRARPGLVLGGDRTASATLTVGDRTVPVAGTAAVRVIDAHEEPEASPAIGPDTVYTAHIGAPGDVDYYRLPVPPKGTTVVLRLGNQTDGADVDLAVYSPPSTHAVRSVPLRSVPLRSVPMADEGLNAQASGQTLSTGLQEDMARRDDMPLRAVSQARGDADERIGFVSDVEPGADRFYTVQVSGYNGSAAPLPYVLYTRQMAPKSPPECPSPRRLPRAGEGVAGVAPSPASLPAGLNTLFLVPQQRMGDTYGADAASRAVSALQNLATRSDLGVVGAVWPVEASPAVSQALVAWDAQPCLPARANDAFRAVADIVDHVRAARPTLRYIVVAGGDDLIPMARLGDRATLANESDYVDDVRNGDGALNGTPLTAALASSHFLSDDPLGDTDPIPWLDHELYVPDLAVGRLVESPADIVAAAEQFAAAGGRLDPGTALTTGYDFLSDGARAVDAGLGRSIPASSRTTLINEDWTSADVQSALAAGPGVASINAHYDHHRSLPGRGNATGDESDLFTTEHLQAMPRRVLFTMGCHAGLNVPDSYMTEAGRMSDWAQTIAENGAAVYLANTGYGYGDTAAVAYSEELMRLFAERLDGSLTVGEAALFAKQAYIGALGAYSAYDEKVVQQAALYGLPMYRVGGSGTVPPPPAGVVTAPDGDGIQSSSLVVEPTFTKHTSEAGGTYFSVGGEVQLMHYRPVEPRTSRDVTPADQSLTARGVLITDLASTDQPVVPAMARPVVDLSANEPPPPAGDVAFPASIHNLTHFTTPTGTQQRAVFVPGQFFRDANWAGNGGVQRLFRRIGAEVKYSASDDFTAPFISNVGSTLADGTLTVRMTATDDSGVVRAVALVKDESGSWRRVELSPVVPGALGGQFTGTLEGVQGTRVEWFGQAMDAVGNVGATTNKARYFGARNDTGIVPLALSPQEPTGSNGWFIDPVTVAIPGREGVAYTLSVDGVTQPYTGPLTLSDDGVHLVEARGSDGSLGAGVVPIDASPPVLRSSLSAAPNAAGWFKTPVVVSFSCTDTVSEVRSCGPGTTVGEGAGQLVTGVAVDYAGNQTSTVVGPLNVDLTAPVVSIDGVVDGQSYPAGAAPSPTCSATDALSGLDGACTLVVTGPSGGGGGRYEAVATARDRAGNVRTVSAVWYVEFVFSGFLDPINDTGSSITSSTSVFKAGSTVPVKFQLFDASGTPISVSPAPQWITPVRGPALGSAQVNEGSVKATATSGSSFVFDAKGGKYQYNWQTGRDMAGYYWLIGARLPDGSTHTVYVGIK